MPNDEGLARAVRLYVFGQAAATGRIPQAAEIARALTRDEADIRAALEQLATGRALILAPNHGDIWAANPFCAVPSGFRVRANGRKYRAICAWDALGIAAALHADAVIDAPCGDCGAAMTLEVRDGALVHSDGVLHFAVPARQWWNNIGFT
jgi:alkylmercury lyase-like protein